MILQFLPILSLFFIHPLENLTITQKDIQDYNYEFVQGNVYIAPDDGWIRSISFQDDTYQITLQIQNDIRKEIVYSGVTEVFLKQGAVVKKGDYIGKDETITEKSKLVLFYYDNISSFPQFTENRLCYYVPVGTKIHMIADGKVNLSGTFSEQGSFVHLVFENTQYSSFYNHLTTKTVRSNDEIQQGQLIGYSGSTGAITEPQLGLVLLSETGETSFKGECVKITE